MTENSVVSVVKYFISMVKRENSVVSIIRDLILIVVKGKQCSEHSQRYPFKSSEVK